MRAAVLGAGVIGQGWIARFLLHGWDVVVFDQAPEVSVRVRAPLAQARGSLQSLYDADLPPEGQLSFAVSAEAAVAGADWVQESVPEDIEIKRALYKTISKTLPKSVPLASSTSGFKPSNLAQGLTCADQFMVCHPFNPVYLLPVVEVVPAPTCAPDLVQTAMQRLGEVGMHPIKVRREIDAHIADRLLEALWREALWLVKDDVATTAEIDDVMRYGFGLRWAQMGLFETYRIAGGEAGMSHFLAQFGPALAWPWSKLTDVPELDSELIEKIAQQSERQSGHLSISQLVERRDNNLVAILRALKSTDSGAGQLVNAMDKTLGLLKPNPTA
jgi:carnitine 3-dehydrogenase